jgi:SAM-dependent methyltransferase
LVDRWRSVENGRLFPELGNVVFPEPDVICDLAASSLDAFGSATMDFIVASHVIEHVPNPLGLLEGIHRVLRPGAVVVLLVPDRRHTFDRGRPPTSLEHVVADYDNGETEVTDAHVAESIAHLQDVEAMSENERQRAFAEQRARSLHVHCWTPMEFNELLAYAIERLGQRWDLVDAVISDDWVPPGIEFGYVLRKSTVELNSMDRRDRFVAGWAEWSTHRRQLPAVMSAPAVAGGALVDVALATRRWVPALTAALKHRLRGTVFHAGYRRLHGHTG